MRDLLREYGRASLGIGENIMMTGKGKNSPTIAGENSGLGPSKEGKWAYLQRIEFQLSSTN